jgi:hypothetical protein
MKKLIRLLAFVALVTAFALPVLAQTTPSTTTATPAATQDETQAKADLYARFRDNIKTNPTVAYEAGKEYLQKYEATDGAEDQYVKYIKKWVMAYDKVARKNRFAEQLKAKNYNEAFATGKQILADDPEDLSTLYDLSRAGFAANTSGNEANNADSIAYAKKTMQLLQAGRTFEKDKPVTNKDEIVGGLNYVVGFLLRKTQPAEAANYFINAAQVEGFAKKDPQTYIFLADAYETTEYTRLATQFSTNCKTEDQLKTTECTEMSTKINQVVDRMIDALARAIAYSKSGPDAAKYDQARTTWMKQLTDYYKYRNNGSETGLPELIASITSRPLPKPGETVAPMTPSSTTAPAQPNGTTNTAPSNTTTTAKPNTTSAKPSSTTPASTTTPSNGKTTSAAQPSGKTTPKRAHTSGKRG